jgi:hypothetical protein
VTSGRPLMGAGFFVVRAGPAGRGSYPLLDSDNHLDCLGGTIAAALNVSSHFEPIAFTILSARLSAWWFAVAMNAQIVAGIQPTIVSCSIKHKIPEKICPIVKNASQGRNSATK